MSSHPADITQQSPKTPGSITRYPILSFSILAFALSWIGWSPWWLGQDGIGLLPIPGSIQVVALVNPLGILGPAIAALIVVRVTEGKAGVRRFWTNVTNLRFRLRWWGIALIGVPALLLAGVIFLPGTLGSFTTEGLGAGLLIYPVQLLGIVFLGGGLEEIGWRGFAQPKLQKKCPPLLAAMLIGVLWAGWHAPLFLTQIWDTPRGSIAQVLLYTVVVIGLSVIMAWVRNGSDSILAAILAHASVNCSLGVLVVAFPDSLVETTNWWGMGILVAAIVLAVVTNGRLGAAMQSAESPPSEEPLHDDPRRHTVS